MEAAVQDLMRGMQELTTEVQNLKAENAALKQLVLSRDSATKESILLGGIVDNYDRSAKTLRGFLDSCLVHFTFKPYYFSTPRAKVGFIISHLSGNALTWATPFVNSGDALLDNYDGFIQALKAMFDRPEQVFSAQERLLDFQQGSQDMLTYVTRFKQLAKEADWSAEACSTLFRRGLNEDIKDELARVARPGSFQTLMDLAMQIDFRIQERKAEKKKTKVPLQKIPIETSSKSDPTPVSVNDPEPMQLGAFQNIHYKRKSGHSSEDSYGGRPYQCTEREKSFTHKSNLYSHQKIHTGRRPYQCTECKKIFTKRLNLQNHERIHTGEKPYECTVCPKHFRSSFNLNCHQRIPTGEKPYKCTECKKAFTYSSALRRHQRIHTGEKPYECTVCKKCFSSCSNLSYHQRIHTGGKPYECTVCQKCFSSCSNLNYHQRIHSEEKPYECTECKKAFTNSSTLKRHHRLHTGEKPYECTVCQKRFSYYSSLNWHQKVHAREKIDSVVECVQASEDPSCEQTLGEHEV
ncbi:putative zinc finger protein 286B [Ambystoma mexicanum]|uniref:putative zinc finger protein 286B n=1 Tax=Ambystoma mexicanum TaxID=8296 RepID=UPI0037E8CE6B